MELQTAARGNEGLVERAVGVITLAFSADPIARWAYPDPHDFYTYFPPFIRAFAGGAFEARTAYVAEDYAGAALWLPPGVHPDEEAMGAIIEATIPEDRLEALGEFVEKQSALHPDYPHWYLPLIGVDPMRQGTGVGSRLLEESLAASDRDGLPAYLEATTVSSRRLYERHGFETVAEIKVEGSPPMWPMLRQPHGA